MSGLTDAQRRALEQMAKYGRVKFEATAMTEAVCQLDSMGLAYAYVDAAHSMDFVIGQLAPAGRSICPTRTIRAEEAS